MIDDTNQLSETFAAHEHLAPDAADVLARAHGIARSLHRRRWAVRATGGAVLGAGLVAGGIALPGRAGPSTGSQTVASTQIGTGSDPTPTATAASYTDAQEINAFFAAGYDYSDAQALSQLWNDGSTITQVKAEAGLKLLDGDTLPVPPSSQPETALDRGVTAFFAAGYTYDDAVTLSKMWHESSYKAKGDAGDRLLAGQTLPIQPSGPPDPNAGSARIITPGDAAASKAQALIMAKGAKKVLLFKAGATGVTTPTGTPADSSSDQEDAFFAAGYDYNDAVSLGKIWNETDIGQIKAEANQKLVDGQTLPVAPSGQPEAAEDSGVAAFFAAGYTYEDAVKLGKIWNDSNTYQVKGEAGQKLLNHETLPIAP